MIAAPFTPTHSPPQLPGVRPSWFPQDLEGTRLYVEDILRETFLYKIQSLDPLWVPVGILSTLTWMKASAWWPFIYSSVFHTSEEYRKVFSTMSSKIGKRWELDPEHFMVFRDDPTRSAFSERRMRVGLTDIEEGEIVSFIRNAISDQLRIEAPPEYIIKTVVWATIIWVLDPLYGSEWLYMQDPLISSAMDFKISFLDRYGADQEEEPNWNLIIEQTPFHIWTLYGMPENGFPQDARIEHLKGEFRKICRIFKINEYPYGDLYQFISDVQIKEGLPHNPWIDRKIIDVLKQKHGLLRIIDPRVIESTERPVGSCSNCGESLWCVEYYGASEGVNIVAPHSTAFVAASPAFVSLCNACVLTLQNGVKISKGSRLGENYSQRPNCNTKFCRNQACPHLEVVIASDGRRIPRAFLDAGQQQIANFVRYLQGTPSGYLYGMTADQIAGAFHGQHNFQPQSNPASTQNGAPKLGVK